MHSDNYYNEKILKNMFKVCEKCNKQYGVEWKKCPVCGKRLKNRYSAEELKEIQKQNDDMTVINTMMM